MARTYEEWIGLEPPDYEYENADAAYEDAYKYVMDWSDDEELAKEEAQIAYDQYMGRVQDELRNYGKDNYGNPIHSY